MKSIGQTLSPTTRLFFPVSRRPPSRRIHGRRLTVSANWTSPARLVHTQPVSVCFYLTPSLTLSYCKFFQHMILPLKFKCEQVSLISASTSSRHRVKSSQFDRPLRLPTIFVRSRSIKVDDNPEFACAFANSIPHANLFTCASTMRNAPSN